MSGGDRGSIRVAGTGTFSPLGTAAAPLPPPSMIVSAALSEH